MADLRPRAEPREVSAAKRRRVTVTITHDAYAKAEREAADSNKTVAQWIAWLVEDYAPPEEVDSDA
jgi:hypothetical protein